MLRVLEVLDSAGLMFWSALSDELGIAEVVRVGTGFVEVRYVLLEMPIVYPQ